MWLPNLVETLSLEEISLCYAEHSNLSLIREGEFMSEGRRLSKQREGGGSMSLETV